MKEFLRRVTPKHFWNLGHLGLAYLGAWSYGFPARNLMVIGVTGTNGKSTTIALLHQVFSDFGLSVASITSVRERIGEHETVRGTVSSKKNTMPGRLGLQQFLSRARRAGCHFAIIEVTSEGIAQHRHRGISFDAAVLTNMRPEHIEAHGSFEEYREAKGRLFAVLGRRLKKIETRSIVNVDDPSAFYYLHMDADRKWGFGTDPSNVREDIVPVIVGDSTVTADEIRFTWDGLDWEVPLVGDFYLYNVLAAIATARSFGIPSTSIRDSLRTARGVPGRFETVLSRPFHVVVDYAHTPDALESVYRSAARMYLEKSGHLIAVLGSAGGGRDVWKRPEFGRIADEFADSIILTNEDPYNEDPLEIVHAIERGIRSGKARIVLDRESAIRAAIEEARPGDVVLITGKGAEQTIMLAEGPMPWDDREVVREIVHELRLTKKE